MMPCTVRYFSKKCFTNMKCFPKMATYETVNSCVSIKYYFANILKMEAKGYPLCQY